MYGLAGVRSLQPSDVLKCDFTCYTCSSVTVGENVNYVDALLFMYCHGDVSVTGMLLANFSPSEKKCCSLHKDIRPCLINAKLLMFNTLNC